LAQGNVAAYAVFFAHLVHLDGDFAVETGVLGLDKLVHSVDGCHLFAFDVCRGVGAYRQK